MQNNNVKLTDNDKAMMIIVLTHHLSIHAIGVYLLVVFAAG